MTQKTIGVVGCGSLGTLIATGISTRLSDRYSLVGVCDASVDRSQTLACSLNCAAYCDIENLIGGNPPDYIIEAAGGAFLKKHAINILHAGCDLLVLSVGVFADEYFYREVKETAERLERKVHIPSGAIGGFDLIRSAVWQGALKASISNVKPPGSLEGAPFLQGKKLSTTQEEQIYSGSARTAIELFPNNVNVAVALALAASNIDSVNVSVVSAPNLTLNTHVVFLEGEFGNAKLEIASVPYDNASSSALAAYSVLAKLENLSSAIQF